jgi:hypothetical protein
MEPQGRQPLLRSSYHISEIGQPIPVGCRSIEWIALDCFSLSPYLGRVACLARQCPVAGPEAAVTRHCKNAGGGVMMTRTQAFNQSLVLTPQRLENPKVKSNSG